MDPELLQMLQDAAINHQWLLLGVGLVCLLVPLVLKAMGKSVPVVDSLLDMVLKIAKGFKKSPVAPVNPVAHAGSPEGAKAVVVVEEEKKS